MVHTVRLTFSPGVSTIENCKVVRLGSLLLVINITARGKNNAWQKPRGVVYTMAPFSVRKDDFKWLMWKMFFCLYLHETGGETTLLCLSSRWYFCHWNLKWHHECSTSGSPGNVSTVRCLDVNNNLQSGLKYSLVAQSLGFKLVKT